MKRSIHVLALAFAGAQLATGVDIQVHAGKYEASGRWEVGGRR